MPVRRRRPATKRVAKRQEPSRVLKISSEEAWNKLNRKHTDSLIIVHFSGAFATPSKQLRPYFAQFAKLPQFSHVTFVEIDVETMSTLASGLGIGACPTIACFRNGEMIQMSGRGEGGNPAFIKHVLDQHAGEKPVPPRWRGWLSKALVAAATVAAAAVAWHSLRGGTRDTQARIQAIDGKMKTAKAKLNVAKRRKQDKIVIQLSEQLDRLAAEHQALEQMASSHAEAELAGTSAARGSADSGYSSGEESGWGAEPPSDSDSEAQLSRPVLGAAAGDADAAVPPSEGNGDDDEWSDED